MSPQNNILSYISHFEKLIEHERYEETLRHLDEIRRLSPKRRENKGRAILNLSGSYAGRGIGGTIQIRYSRDVHFKNHEFSIGDLVIATTEKKPSGKEQQGTIVDMTQRSMIVSYAKNPAPYHFENSGIRLDLFANEITFTRMIIALKRLKRKPEISRVLLGHSKLEKQENIGVRLFNENLNDKQKEAVERTLCAKDFHLIHGPPGTGKTTTLVESIMQHSVYCDKILVTADSNTAIDNVIEKLLKYTKNVVRIGNPSRIESDLVKCSLQEKLEEEQFFRDAKSLWKDVDRIKKIQSQLIAPTKERCKGLKDKQIRRLAKQRRTARNIPHSVMRKMGMWLDMNIKVKDSVNKAQLLEKEALKRILDRTQIICTTNSSASSEILEEYYKISNEKFSVAFIDEATQAVEPSCVIPIVLSKKFILAGDHKQLPPTVLSPNAKALEFSLFERLIHMYTDKCSTMLDTQYRMHKKIMAFSNEEFYGGKLKAHPQVAEHSIEDLSKVEIENELINGKNPCIFLDVKGEESQKEGSFSFSNQEEANATNHIIESLYNQGLVKDDIGIISPYNDQVEVLKERFPEIEVKSIDGFQGREKEVIIVNFVRANREGMLGFVEDVRRLNVALTRAKRKLILIGNMETLQTNKTFKKLLELSSLTSFEEISS